MSDQPHTEDKELDIETESPIPTDILAENSQAAPAPKPTLDDLPFDADSDIPLESDVVDAPSGLFDKEHWSQENVRGDQPMVKDVPPGYSPMAIISIPSASQLDIERIVEAIVPVADKLGQDTREWAEVLRSSRSFLIVNNQFDKTLKRSDSNWVQAVDLDGVRMTASVPGHAKVAPGTVLSGADAVIQMSRALGTYARMQFPLPHSGVWLNIAVPGGDELHTLEHRLAEAKYELGWMGKGLVYSNTMVMQNIELVNFILERVVATNLEDSTIAGMKKAIRITDLNLMAANLASSIYPSGFPLERPCSADPLKCHEVTRGILRLSKIIWTDENAFSPWQKKHMQTRMVGRKKTADDLAKYQEEFVGIGTREVDIAPGVRVRFLPPTLEQYEQSGYAWIDQIERTANQMLTTLSESALNDYMTQQYQMTTMRQYAHWVDAIIYPSEEGDVVVTGREEINESLKKASTDTEVVNRFMAAVRDYIDDCTVSVVAINNYSCPKCGKSQTHEASKNPRLIPLDAVHTFFTLSGLKTQTTLLKNMEH